jgi:hypothetical protein
VKNVKLRARLSSINFDITKIVIFSAIDAQIAITNFGFEKARANPKTVTTTLYLYLKGVSSRKIKRNYAYLNKRINE